MSWTQVYCDITVQDQVDRKYDPDKDTYEERLTQTYVAVSNTVAATAYSASLASGPTTPGGSTTLAVPSLGDTVSISGIDGYWDVVHILPKRSADSPFKFEIQVEFYRKTSPEDGDKWSKQLSITGQAYTQNAQYDKDGNGVWNSAGDMFDPELPETFYDEVISYSYRTISPPDLSAYRGKVNSDTVSFTISGISRSFSARQMKLENGEISTTITSDGQTPVWDVKITFITRVSDQFINYVLDAGKYWRDGGVQSPNLLAGDPPAGFVGGGGPPAGGRYPITAMFGGADQAGQHWLDGSGMPVDFAPGGPAPTPSWLGFKIETEVAFSGLF